jgi:large subunit ribosomal protein L16
MIFIPSFNKLKKNHLIKPQKSISNKKLKLSKNNNYTYGIKSLNDGYLVNTQIESIRKSIVRVLREKKLKGFYSSFIFRVYPHVSITKKPKGVRMGGGKGSHDS